MPTLYKYWIKEFFKFFLVIQLIILVLFVFIDYLSRLDRFLYSELSLLEAFFGYILLKVPFMFVQLTPAGILLSSIAVFGLMNKNNELLAIRSSGISIYFLIKPAIHASIALALLMFFLGETIIPVTMERVYHLKFNVIPRTKQITTARENFWIRSENKLIHINFYDAVNKVAKGVTISELGENNTLVSRIDARKGLYDNEIWTLYEVLEQNYSEASADYRVDIQETKQVDLSFKPEDLGEVTRKSEEMSSTELRRLVRKIENEGYDAGTYTVDLYSKYSFPFICVIMMIFGAATGMKSFVKENLPVGIALGVMIAFSYWIVYGFCLSLGYGSVLPPIISAWVANIFFFFAGVIYLVYAE
jgi:lipopolysaccharide export system permease protein